MKCRICTTYPHVPNGGPFRRGVSPLRNRLRGEWESAESSNLHSIHRHIGVVFCGVCFPPSSCLSAARAAKPSVCICRKILPPLHRFIRIPVTLGGESNSPRPSLRIVTNDNSSYWNCNRRRTFMFAKPVLPNHLPLKGKA